MRSEIDSWKKSLVDHVFFDHDGFRLLKRHFQMSLWVNHLREWVLVDYDSSVEECLNRHQISRRNDQYWLRVNLNEGKTAEICGYFVFAAALLQDGSEWCFIHRQWWTRQ